MEIDVSNSTVGKLTNTSVIRKKLMDFIILNDVKNLKYEWRSLGTKQLVFITGKNDKEQALPILEDPMVLDYHIVVDVRAYVKPNKDFTSLSEIVSNETSLNFIVHRAMIMADLYDIGNSGGLGISTLIPFAATAYASWLKTVFVVNLRLDIVEESLLEVALLYFFFSMVDEAEDIDNKLLGIIATRIHKSQARTTTMTIDRIMEYISDKGKVESIDDLIKLIKDIVSSPKLSHLDLNLLSNMMINTWYGPNADRNVMLAIEHLPTWLSMYYNTTTMTGYKKTKLATILSRDKKHINSNDFIKKYELYINSRHI